MVLNLPVLQRLEINFCTSLVSLPEGMQKLTSLKFLRIERCDGLKSLSNCLQHLTSLHVLEIRYCSVLELLPDDFQNLISLQELKLRFLPRLGAVPDVSQIKYLATPLVWSFEIINCPMLVSLPEGMQNLTSLQFLSIDCFGLKSLNNCLQLLTNLHKLEIRNCPALELLPDDFQNLISLKVLQLNGLPNLTAVPVVRSLILKTISFSMCPHLKNLPDWITNQTLLQTLELVDCENLKSLPEGFHQLTALYRFQIKACNPLLHERFKEDTGEDWHKIAHIPELIIGSPAKLNIVPPPSK